MSTTPTVSVIIATYGRPEVLPYAIKSALAQTLKNIEVIVVGDAAGDETKAVVASFDDSRVCYTDLAINYGEQSGPNNVGVLHSRADIIAFLNQDDMWFPDHLAIAKTWLDATNSELVYGYGALVDSPTNSHLGSEYSWSRWHTGQSNSKRYDPGVTYAPASTWVLRSDLHSRINGWRPAVECRRESSQDFLKRAWRSGARMSIIPKICTVLIQSGNRKNSYIDKNSSVHGRIWHELTTDKALRLKIMDQIRSDNTFRLLPRFQAMNLGEWSRSAISGLRLVHYAEKAGMTRFAQRLRFHGAKRGEQIVALRRTRGLPPMLSAGAHIDDIRFKEILAQGQALDGNCVVSFGRFGLGYQCRLAGWHPPTDSYSQTAYPWAHIMIYMNVVPQQPVLVEFHGELSVNSILNVYANNTHLGVWQNRETHVENTEDKNKGRKMSIRVTPDMFSQLESYFIIKINVSSQSRMFSKIPGLSSQNYFRVYSICLSNDT